MGGWGVPAALLLGRITQQGLQRRAPSVAERPLLRTIVATAVRGTRRISKDPMIESGKVGWLGCSSMTANERWINPGAATV